RAWRRGCVDVLEGAFLRERERGEAGEPFVDAAREARHLAHPVVDGAAHPIVRVRAKRHAARRIVAARGIEQPLAPEAAQIVELHRTPDEAPDLPGDDLD